jgi:hypothetical protein
VSERNKQLYWVWADMLGRCRNPNHRAFKNYGGRGISVCEQWSAFDVFSRDMGPRPLGGLLDRIDNNGPYQPGNCRWATRQEQNSNRRNCIYIDMGGVRVTLKEYCRSKELPYRAIMKRIRDRNWPLAMALQEPVRPGKRFYRIPT